MKHLTIRLYFCVLENSPLCQIYFHCQVDEPVESEQIVTVGIKRPKTNTWCAFILGKFWKTSLVYFVVKALECRRRRESPPPFLDHRIPPDHH